MLNYSSFMQFQIGQVYTYYGAYVIEENYFQKQLDLYFSDSSLHTF